jgi:Tfp pilus assembly protein PilF
MKNKVLSLCTFFLLFGFCAMAQSAQELHETAKKFMQQGDHANAVIVLNRATQLEPNNLALAKDLALNLYLQNELQKSVDILKPWIEKDEADDQMYIISADNYLLLEQPNEAEKIYKKGLLKFADNGPLYNKYGELLWGRKDLTAIKFWEKGIELDPSYSKNYYNACKYYYFTTDKVWSIIYGEIFLNIEPSNSKTPEVKNILLSSYKKLFTNFDLEKDNKDKNPFVLAFLKTINKQSSVAALGINTESLIMIRTRFILDWFATQNEKFPLKLFQLQRQLLQEGMFAAYNQWVFGITENIGAYQNWITTNATEYGELTRFQKGRVFKIPTGQYYHQ